MIGVGALLKGFIMTDYHQVVTTIQQTVLITLNVEDEIGDQAALDVEMIPHQTVAIVLMLSLIHISEPTRPY